jgi:glycosyltransferase involved in cell wall biosynthesis
VWCKANVPRASAIVTVSEHVRNQILDNFSIPSAKVRTVYNGVDDRFRPLSKSIAFRKQYGLPDRYILFVGISYANKNIRRLIEAYTLVRQNRGLDHHLVIAGAPGTEANKLRDFVKNNRLENIVHFCGYFPDKDLPKLYRHADLFVYPSMAEGFGLPPLEAMACGTPVIASDIPIFHEVLDESAILVNPYSVEAISEGMTKALLDASIRDKLTIKGFERAKRFSWKKMAAEMVRIFEEAANSS